ncbi:MAG: aldehyde ferredoxin oxidoreductase family protein [Candidatus Hodarchaeales archaeon]
MVFATGNNNQILRIDLSKHKIKVEPRPKITRTFLGGKGLGAYILTRELKPKIDPLGPENKIVIVTGPLQGSVVPICGRYAIITKSPLTGLFLDSHAGGSIGPELKFAGYDALIIEGSSPKPVFIYITDKSYEIRDASHLKGLSTLDKELELKKELGSDTKIMSIGQAGENLIKIACVTGESFRNIGRGGVGAVFGSKKLLAIAIKGKPKSIPVADSTRLEKLANEVKTRAKTGRESDHWIYKWGTPALLPFASEMDQLPVKNFQEGTLKDPDKLGPKEMDKFKTKKKPCYKCVVSCSHVFDQKFDFAKPEHIIAVPEYETLGLIGANCGVDFQTVIEANYLANSYGLDTISLGNLIAWFMETCDKGLVPEQYTSEKVYFGDKKGLINLIHKIARKEGVGAILAEGPIHATKIFGYDSQKFSIHVKGLPMAAWDPRGKLGLGLSYATAEVGASHLRGWPSTTKIPNEPITEEIIDSLIEGQNLKIIKDCLIICHFTHSIIPALDLELAQDLYSAATGSNVDVREVAQNVWSLTRYFNMREFDNPASEYDTLPHRLLKEALPSGSAQDSKAFISDEDFQNGLEMLYSKRRCKINGDLTSDEIKRIKKLLELRA